MTTPDKAVTIVTTCMGRLSFLQRTLPTWLERTDFRVVVVDYSCPDGTADWIETGGFGPRVTAVRGEAALAGGRRVFHLSRARNVGAREVKNGYLLFLDADHELSGDLGKWFGTRLAAGRMFLPLRPAHGGGQLGGALALSAQVYREVGGFDEGLVGWGSEDTEFKLRLHLRGLRMVQIPLGHVSALPHPNSLRTEHYEDPDLFRSQRRNRDYLNAKYLQTTGKSYSDWMRDRYVRFALGLIRPRRS